MTTWMNFKCILLTERSKTQKTAYCMIALWKRKNFRDRNCVNGCQGLEIGTRDNS